MRDAFSLVVTGACLGAGILCFDRGLYGPAILCFLFAFLNALAAVRSMGERKDE